MKNIKNQPKNISKNKNLLEGPITKSIFKLALPVIGANVLQTVYQLIDTFWVGRLGAEAVAAVSLSFPILFFLNSLALGMAMAGSILVAQYNGAKDQAKINLAASQTLSLVSLVALGITAIGLLISNFLLSYLTNDPLVLEQADAYLKISFLATLSVFIYFVFQSVLRSVGEVRLPIIIVLVTVIINFFLDPLFMFGWGPIPALGVAGVAWATFITESLSAFIGLALLLLGTYGIKLRWHCLKPRKNFVKKIFKLGLPSSLEMSSRSLGMFLMTFLVSTFGTLVVASFGIGARVLSFVIIPSMGFAIAVSTLVGNNLGAQQLKRTAKIVRTGLKIGFFTLTGIGLLTFLGAQYLATFFVPSEPEVIAIATKFIRIMSISFGCIGYQMVVLGSYKAAGRTTTSMLLAIIHTFILFTSAYLLAHIFRKGELGIWLAYPIANFSAMFIAWRYYKSKKWLDSEIIKAE